MTDAQGIPLTVTLTGANVPDITAAWPTLQTLPAIRGPRGRPRRKPTCVTGGKGYDAESLRQTLRRLGIRPEFPQTPAPGPLGPTPLGSGAHDQLVESVPAVAHSVRAA